MAGMVFLVPHRRGVVRIFRVGHMSKAGRPRKGGNRHPCGKRTPKAREDDIMQTAVEARIRIWGVSRDLASTDVMGSPLQRLQHWGYITTAQADAGHNFAVTLRDYLATANLLRPTQGKAGFIPGAMASSDSGEPVKGETKAKLYMEALREIDRLDLSSAPSATSVVWTICIDEKDWMSEAAIGALRVGLNAIHRIWYGRKAA